MTRIATFLLACGFAVAMAACDSGDGATESDTHDTHGTHDSHDSHDSHSHDSHSAEAEVTWDAMPPATAAVGTPFTASFKVDTMGDIHVTELRACMGENHMCGLGGEETFDVSVPAPAAGEGYEGELTLDSAGTWTVVGYTHVDADPHISAHALVTVE